MNYYSGGLAELVSEPSRLTYSFLNVWFRGAESLGKAMELLGLPHENRQASMLVVDNEGKLRVDLDEEERTLYAKTVFSYKQREDISLEPELRVNWSKMFGLKNWWGTGVILYRQVEWLVKTNVIIKNTEDWIEDIRNLQKGLKWEAYDELLKDRVWPRVIACGIICEYYYQVLKKTYDKENLVWGQINEQMGRDLAESGINISEYYELTSDRRNSAETPEQRPVPMDLKFENMWVISYLKLHKNRVRLRKLCLEYFHHLRMAILEKVQSKEVGEMTRDELITGKVTIKPQTSKVNKRKVKYSKINHGWGRPVSGGQVTGKLVFVKKDNFEKVDYHNVIGVFPNASTEFTICYPKCKGIIFLAGGQTSHGAIVAREYKIPAIIDSMAINIPENSIVQLNGGTGGWECLIVDV